MTVHCHSCGDDFADYHELALHILSSNKGHRQGKKWAARYTSRSVMHKVKFNGGRNPLTDEVKQAKEDSKRVLSGGQSYVGTICPKCKKSDKTVIEVEYAKSPSAWRVGGKIVKMCENCVGVR